MSDAAVLFVKPKAIKASDKKTLRSAGIIVIEVDDPTSMKFTRAGVNLPHGDLLACFGQAIDQSGTATSALGSVISAMVQLRAKAPATP